MTQPAQSATAVRLLALVLAASLGASTGCGSGTRPEPHPCRAREERRASRETLRPVVRADRSGSTHRTPRQVREELCPKEATPRATRAQQALLARAGGRCHGLQDGPGLHGNPAGAWCDPVSGKCVPCKPADPSTCPRARSAIRRPFFACQAATRSTTARLGTGARSCAIRTRTSVSAA